MAATLGSQLDNPMDISLDYSEGALKRNNGGCHGLVMGVNEMLRGTLVLLGGRSRGRRALQRIPGWRIPYEWTV